MLLLGADTGKESRFPWVTCGLIAVNLLGFAIQQAGGPRVNYGFSLIPAEIAQGRDLVKPQRIKLKMPVHDHPAYPRARGRRVVRYEEQWVDVPQYPGPVPIYLTLITSMFMHGDLFHLAGNMWFLFVFGCHIENAMRGGLFLGFYLFCGVAAGVAHVLADPQSVIPCMGASGAISGVMAAYLSVYPFSTLRIWFGWRFGVVEVPALAGLAVWFILQYLSAMMAAQSGAMHGVAYWAHIGGFVAGLVFLRGLIFYLKARVAFAQANSAPEPAEQPEPPPDPFANFLPSAPKRPPEDAWR
jgi:membrane associated rhomboid family serine protease